MGDSDFSLNSIPLRLGRIGLAGQSTIRTKLSSSKPQFQSCNYIINLIKREKGDPFVDIVYHAGQGNRLLFCSRLG